LPPPSFEPAPQVWDYWTDCDVYRRSEGLTEANNALQAVESLHRKPSDSGTCWLDVRGRRFQPARHRHGLTPVEPAGGERFRFCFKVPGGFHYDVDHHRSQAFLLYDRFGNAHKVLRANVDPWGSIRK
jgi:hypothetical protein